LPHFRDPPSFSEVSDLPQQNASALIPKQLPSGSPIAFMLPDITEGDFAQDALLSKVTTVTYRTISSRLS
jgi:hypothetical protein